MNDNDRAAFSERFARGAQLLLEMLPEDRQAELELFSRAEYPTATPFAEYVELRVAGSYVGSLSRSWLESGEGDPVFYPVSREA